MTLPQARGLRPCSSHVCGTHPRRTGDVVTGPPVHRPIAPSARSLSGSVVKLSSQNVPLTSRGGLHR